MCGKTRHNSFRKKKNEESKRALQSLKLTPLDQLKWDIITLNKEFDRKLE